MNSYDPQYMQLKEQKLKEIINKEKTVTSVSKAKLSILLLMMQRGGYLHGVMLLQTQ